MSCSGDLAGNMWSYDPQRRLVMVVYQHEGVDIPVASERNPREGAYSLRRLDTDGSCWQIGPSRFTKRRAQWASYAAPYDGGVPAEFLQLVNCPPGVTAELDALL